MSFQAPFSITEYARMQMLADQQKSQQQQQNQQMVMNGLMQLGGAAADYYGQQNELAGMDKTTMAMKDEGIIDQDTLQKYLAAPGKERSFLFQNFIAPQMGAFNAGNAAEAQASAYARYRGSGAGGGATTTGMPVGGFRVY
jgi:hypothetical protein